VSPRHRPHHHSRNTNPSIEVADANDAYLSPDLAKNSDGRDWGMLKRRDRSEDVEHRRPRKKTRGGSDDDEDEDEFE